MICSAISFFPRGIECPPLVLTLTDYRFGSHAVEAGQVNFVAWRAPQRHAVS